MEQYGWMPGRYPAVIKSYDAIRRTCRVDITGLTTGGDVFPEAEIEYPVGDKSNHERWATEIEFLPNDTVWVSFIGGDPRYPIITGYRNPRAGNRQGWRKWHHENIEMIADGQVIVTAGSEITLKAPNVTINANKTRCTGDFHADGDVTAGAISLKEHKHDGVRSGDSLTGKPKG